MAIKGIRSRLMAENMKRIFHTLETTTEYRVSFTTHRFSGVVIALWETLGYTYDTGHGLADF